MTPIERLKELDEPYRTKALNNFSPSFFETHSKVTEPYKRNNAMYVLSVAFDWSASPEGYGYWQDLYLKNV